MEQNSVYVFCKHDKNHETNNVEIYVIMTLLNTFDWIQNKITLEFAVTV